MKTRLLLFTVIISLLTGCAGVRNIDNPDDFDADFKATGNEPFWGLEIGFDEGIVFRSFTEEYPLITAAIKDLEMPGDSLKEYSVRSREGILNIIISKEECMDNMSGNLFPYRVVLGLVENDSVQKKFEGCGQFIGKYGLNDVWILEKINGVNIGFPEDRKPPFLTIDTEAKSISGFGGCNNFHGNAELVKNRLVTGNIVSTKMACIDIQETENEFLKVLSGKILDYTLLGSTLRMKDLNNELEFVRELNGQNSQGQ
ncbi:MAG: META domain-containing protein [Bacteroidales bacterium]